MSKLAKATRTIAAIGASAGLMLGTTAGPAHADAGLAASCYGRTSYVSPYQSHFMPTDGSYFKTTGYCSDININPTVSTWVKIYFPATGYQANFKWAPAGRWTVVATNVRDNASFAFYFDDLNFHTGQYAA